MIVIERESMLSVSHEPTLQPHRRISNDSCNDDELEYVFVSNLISTDISHNHHYGQGRLLRLLRPTTKIYGGDDDESCSLASTSSLYSSSSSSSTTTLTQTLSSSSLLSENEHYYQQTNREKRRVKFSHESKNEIYIVERMYPRESLSEHFYSYEDTQRFRQEYRLEKKILAELGADESNHYEGDLQDLHNNNTTSTKNNREKTICGSNNSSKHKISRVVVFHNDKIETFCCCDQSRPQEQQEEVHYQEQQYILSSQKTEKSTDDIFDNDSFWSGSMTYY